MVDAGGAAIAPGGKPILAPLPDAARRRDLARGRRPKVRAALDARYRRQWEAWQAAQFALVAPPGAQAAIPRSSRRPRAIIASPDARGASPVLRVPQASYRSRARISPSSPRSRAPPTPDKQRLAFMVQHASMRRAHQLPASNPEVIERAFATDGMSLPRASPPAADWHRPHLDERPAPSRSANSRLRQARRHRNRLIS
jgi:hypothetical protein